MGVLEQDIIVTRSHGAACTSLHVKCWRRFRRHKHAVDVLYWGWRLRGWGGRWLDTVRARRNWFRGVVPRKGDKLHRREWNTPLAIGLGSRHEHLEVSL